MRVSSDACPFCSAAIDRSALNVVPAMTSRRARAQVFAFATTIGIVGCGGSVTETATDAGAGADANVADTSVADTNKPDNAIPTPPDTATEDVPDFGGPMPLYGAAPFREPKK